MSRVYLPGAQGSGESQQERITNLLKKLQLMERCLHDSELKSEEVPVLIHLNEKQLTNSYTLFKLQTGFEPAQLMRIN